jgi:D-amino peptidase
MLLESEDDKMLKAFISVDLEGMPYIVIPGHLALKGTLHDEARMIATKIVLTAADELRRNGFGKVVIADSHGPMVNLLVDDLPDYAEIVRGFPRPLSMVAGVEGCDAAVFLGYHAKFGTAKSTFDHTYSGGTINKVEVNGIASSEFLLNSYVIGELGVPVIMVAGEAQLIRDDVKRHAPWAETVALKHSLSRLAARSPSMKVLDKELRKSVKRAAARYIKGNIEKLTIEAPVKTRITFMTSLYADAAELLPIAKRIDALRVEYVSGSMVEAYKTFELLTMAASGLFNMLETLR